MSNFKVFLDSVLAAIRDKKKGERAPPALLTLLVARTIGTENMEPIDVLSPNELKRCYVAITCHLLADAAKRDELGIFTDVFSEKLAEVAFHLGSRGTGDIVRRFGSHLKRIDAEMEADCKRFQKLSDEYEASLADEDRLHREGDAA
ncbi:MAG: hypothetical protein NT123_24805 [Proteobacteria bacterium]|nr:hypothetical protein [Pseudomonadota bacterium]